MEVLLILQGLAVAVAPRDTNIHLLEYNPMQTTVSEWSNALNTTMIFRSYSDIDQLTRFR